MTRAQRISCVKVFLSIVIAAAYASLFLIGSLIVIHFAGEDADTGAGLVALVIGSIVPTVVACWLTQPHLWRAVDWVFSGEGSER